MGAGIYQRAVAGPGLVQCIRRQRGAFRRLNNYLNGQVVFFAELKVALVVRRDSLHITRAVSHQDEVGDPDRNFVAGERVEGVAFGEDTFFFHLAGHLLARGLPTKFVNFFLDGGSAGDFGNQFFDHRTAGRKKHGGDAVDGVNPCSECFDGFVTVHNCPADMRAGGFANPVALHGDNAFRPGSFQVIKRCVKFFRIVGDFEVPLFEFAQFDRGVLMPPAATVLYLLVGQHGGAFGAPVEGSLLAVGETLLEHLDKEPLVPAVVLGQASGDFRVPVVAEAESF